MPGCDIHSFTNSANDANRGSLQQTANIRDRHRETDSRAVALEPFYALWDIGTSHGMLWDFPCNADDVMELTRRYNQEGCPISDVRTIQRLTTCSLQRMEAPEPGSNGSSSAKHAQGT